MPSDKDFKRRIRERMQRTGESYSIARHHLRSEGGVSPSATPATAGVAVRGRDAEWDRLVTHVREMPETADELDGWLDGFDRWTSLDLQLDPALSLYPRLCIALARSADLTHPRSLEALARAADFLAEGDKPDWGRFEAFAEELAESIPEPAGPDHPLLVLMEAVSDPEECLKGERARALLEAALRAQTPGRIRAAVRAELLEYLQTRQPTHTEATAEQPAVVPSDAKLLELRRRWRRSGKAADEERLLRHAVTLKVVGPGLLELCAFLGHPAALALVKADKGVERERAAFARWGPSGRPTGLLRIEAGGEGADAHVPAEGDDPVDALFERPDRALDVHVEALEPDDPRRDLGGRSLKPEDHFTGEQLAELSPEELARMGCSTSDAVGELFGWFGNLHWWGEEAALRGAVAAARAAKQALASAATEVARAADEAIASASRFLSCPCMAHGQAAQLAGRAALEAARAAGRPGKEDWRNRDLLPGENGVYDAATAASQAAKAASLVASGVTGVLEFTAGQAVRYASTAAGAEAVRDRVQQELIAWALAPAWGDPGSG